MCPIFKHNWVLLLCILGLDTILGLFVYEFQASKGKTQRVVPILFGKTGGMQSKWQIAQWGFLLEFIQ